MNKLHDYCEEIIVDIKKCRRYVGLGAYMSGGIITNIIKTQTLNQAKKRITTIDDYIVKINDELEVLETTYKLKDFQNSAHCTVIYDNAQMNAIVFKQLEKYYKYLDELEKEVKGIKERLN